MFITIIIFIIVLLYTSLNNMRYGSNTKILDIRRILLRLITPRKVYFLNNINDIGLIRLILKSTKKGNDIEDKFASEAWKPIYNVESVDDDLWLRLHKKVLNNIHSLKLDEIRKITSEITNDMMKETKGILFSKDISLLPARIFFKSLFKSYLPRDKYELFFSSSIEWRKEVALKSKGNDKIKNSMIRFISNFLEDKDIESMSSFVQPFFISPMINFNDIYVSVFSNLKCNVINLTKKDCSNIILESIRLSHPFPVLERELLEDISYNNTIYQKGSHFYIELDNFIQDNKFNPDRWNEKTNIYSIIPFGSGPRQCIGKVLAMTILSESLYTIINHIDFKIENIKLEVDHLYSGRNNDNNFNIKETFYVLNKFLIKLIL